MDDYMNDINDIPAGPARSGPVTAEDPVTRPIDQYTPPLISENTYSSADVYDVGTLGSSDGSIVAKILIASMGAVIGAIPGTLLWIIIGKVGFIAALCGALLAGGVVCGYQFVTKDNEISPTVGITVCLVVITVAILLATRIIWCWKLSDQFKLEVKDWSAEVYELADELEYDRSETDKIIEATLIEEFGFSEGTFSEISDHFGDLLEKLDLRGKYIQDLLISFAFAIAGGGSLFKKFSVSI